MSLRDATVTSQAFGLVGIPSAGHCVAAAMRNRVGPALFQDQADLVIAVGHEFTRSPEARAGGGADLLAVFQGQGGTGRGKAIVNDLTFTKVNDCATPVLLGMHLTGTPIIMKFRKKD